MNDKKVAIKGGLWTSASSAVTMLSQFLRVMILTRFIERSDFGIVSIITMIIGLCLAFGDLGFASVIMYKKELTEKEFSSLFWLQLLIYTIIYCLLYAISPLCSSFYDQGILVSLIPLSSLSLIFLAVGKLYETILQKKYEFKLLAIRNIISNVTSLLLAWYLAWRGFGIYSLVYSTLFQSLFYNVWSFLIGNKYFHLRLSINVKEIRPLLNMGLYQTYTRIADYLSSQIDVLIIGKLLGTDTLGGYDLAKQLINKFVGFFRQVVTQIALPILANNNDNDESVKSKFLSITKVVAYICIPICLTLAVFSREIVVLVYGDKYSDISFIASVFAIITLISSITSFFDMLGIAKGRTDLNFRNTLYRIAITIPIVVLSSMVSINAVVIGQLVAALIQVAIFWRIVVMKTYPMSFNIYITQFKKYLIVWLTMSSLLYILKDLCDSFFFIDNITLHFAIYVGFGGLLAVLSFLTVLKQEFYYLYRLIKK